METYPHLAEALAETIEELRLERGLTKTALADFAALQRFYLLNIEKKTNRPTANALFFICDALSIRPSDFFLLVEQKMERMREEARTAPQPALKRAPSRARTKNECGAASPGTALFFGLFRYHGGHSAPVRASVRPSIIAQLCF